MHKKKAFFREKLDSPLHKFKISTENYFYFKSFFLNFPNSLLIRYCASWSYLNECSKNYQWMSSHCPIACGLCELCEDFKEYCEAWSRRGECSKNSKYMKIYCKKVADTGETVKINYLQCQNYFSRAECAAVV